MASLAHSHRPSRRPPSRTDADTETWTCRGRLCLLVVSGQLTWRTSRRLHASFRRAVDAGAREFQVDLRSVLEMDPAGVAVLLVYSRLLPSLGGALEISGPAAPAGRFCTGCSYCTCSATRQTIPPQRATGDICALSHLTDAPQQSERRR